MPAWRRRRAAAAWRGSWALCSSGRSPPSWSSSQTTRSRQPPKAESVFLPPEGGSHQAWDGALQHLPRIHDPERVERLLDRAHDLQPLAVLAFEKLHLAEADAVLARAGAAHRQRTFDQAIRQPRGLVEIRGIVRVHREDHMEVAVAD